MDVMTDPPLTARLKTQTRELHTQAERSGVMAELLHGRIGLPAYCAMLQSLRALYAALEAGLDAHHADINVHKLWQPGLRRLPSLEQDLQCWDPSDHSARQPLLPAARAYVQRLATLSSDAPELLLAHAYVRYLGDLHGGQVLGRLVRQHFGRQGQAGTTFYEFGEPEQVERMRADFRTALDALVLTAAQAGAFVAEACDAFRRHRQLFEELHERHPPLAMQPRPPA